MTSSFAEFLKKEKAGWRIDCPSKDGHRRNEYVSLRALGEWALKNYIDSLEHTSMPMLDALDGLVKKDDLVYKIAVVCLGEAEVKKRLEGLK